MQKSRERDKNGTQINTNRAEQGGNSSAKQAGLSQPQQGLQPSAPPALQFQCTNAPSQVDLESSLARLQLQYAALAARVTSQQEQKEVTQGAPGQGQGAPRLNQYPLVWGHLGQNLVANSEI